MSESIALQAAIDFDDGGGVYETPLLALPDHIRKLRRMVKAVHGGYQRVRLPYLDGVAATLSVAAALYDVNADTAIDDSSIVYCGNVGDFADAESTVASRYLAATIMFTFVWMALEQAVRSVAPEFKGSTGARGRNAFAALANVSSELDASLKLTWSLAAAAGDMNEDLADLSPLLATASGPEAAFELVRRTRNAFAHGHMTPPQPADWGPGQLPPASPEVDRFFAATRIVLLLIAQLLAEAMGAATLELDYEDQLYLEDAGENEEDFVRDAPIGWALLTAHFRDPGLPPAIEGRQ
jgi:hypothetical protein